MGPEPIRRIFWRSSRLGTLLLLCSGEGLIVRAESGEPDDEPLVELVDEPQVLPHRNVAPLAHTLESREDHDQVVAQRVVFRWPILNFAEHVAKLGEEALQPLVSLVGPVLDLSGEPWREFDIWVEDLGDELVGRVETAAVVFPGRPGVPALEGLEIALAAHRSASSKNRSKR